MTDVLVLGGGITGLGVARLAARNGWSVTVLERSDLASGASGASSHMLHGGLRYLESARFALVREALAERSAVNRMAPGLSTPVRFVVPLRRGDRVPAWKLRAGLALYDWLAGRAGMGGHAMAGAQGALALESGLAPSGLAAVGLYTDAVMDDARLAIAVARDAAAHGAVIHTRAEVTGIHPARGGTAEVTVRDYETRVEQRLVARVLVNATGAWSDRTRRDVSRMLKPGSPDPPRHLRPSRGVHLVYPALTHGHGVLALAGSDGRAFFVVPFAGRSLVGTTEVETDSPPATEQLRATRDEIRYLASEVARVLPGAAGLRPIAAFSGVRPLLAAQGAVGGAPREHRVFVEEPLITIAGGKYTTFRIMARDTLAAAARRLGRDPGALRDPAAPLPAPLRPDADPAMLGAHAAEHEWARSLSDVLRRRSTHWLDDDRGLGVAPAVTGGMARRLGWSPEREREEIDRYEAAVRDEQAMLARALEDS